ncbi:uncharacterized protein LOC62_02G001986 [Vanrija pseudolonga]|uniref:SUN domain-containing protein n=1 Tax=Vanrija pseudolonga TaxID=143232 RepID=A0AAF0Y1I0_9TREE|nr:hypothetical protein LOC62_02G001986 [Vanrija pseudolonga]
MMLMGPLALVLALARATAAGTTAAGGAALTPHAGGLAALTPPHDGEPEGMTRGIGDSTRRNWTDAAGKTWQVVDPNPSRLPLSPWGLWFMNIEDEEYGFRCACVTRVVYMGRGPRWPINIEPWPAFDAALLLSHRYRSVLSEDLNVLSWAVDGINNSAFIRFGRHKGRLFTIHVPKHLNQTESGYFFRLATSRTGRVGTYHYSAEFGIKTYPPAPPPPTGPRPDLVIAVGTLLVVVLVAGVWGYKAYRRRREAAGAIQLPESEG